MVPYPTVGGPIYMSAKFQLTNLVQLVQLPIVSCTHAGPAKCSYVHAAAVHHAHHPTGIYAQRLHVTLVVVIICSLLNITSMAISLPALPCSILVHDDVNITFTLIYLGSCRPYPRNRMGFTYQQRSLVMQPLFLILPMSPTHWLLHSL